MKTEINPRQYDHEQLAEQLVAVWGVGQTGSSNHEEGIRGDEFVRLAPHLWRELITTGQPVEPERLAALAGIPLDEALALLREFGEWDPDGQRVVGGGVSLLETQHRYDTDGRTVWTWCAPDLFVVPIVLGASARVQSPCAATGDLVQVTVTPTSVEDVEPASAVTSIVVSPPDRLSAVRQVVCNQQNFYRDAEVAAAWQQANPNGLILPLTDAFEVLLRAFRRIMPNEFLS